MMDFVSPTVTDGVPSPTCWPCARDSMANAIFDVIRGSFSHLQHLVLHAIYLDAVNAEFLAGQLSKMICVRLRLTNITAQQAVAIFTAIGEDDSKLRMIDLSSNDLSSVDPSLFIPPMKFLRGLNLNGTDLTTCQVEAILDGLENASSLTHLCLDDIDVSQVDSTKLAKVNHLKVVTLCQTKISIQQIIEILEASLTATELVEIRWGHSGFPEDRWFAMDVTPDEWHKLKKLKTNSCDL